MDIAKLFSDNIQHSLMITSFVMVMMLVIEFINVYSKGRFSYNFQKKPLLQIIFASILGVIPGCLGTYAVVSLFTHHVIGMGAMVASMIATTGDEAFLMLSLFPGKSILLFGLLLFLAILSGYIIHLFEKKKAQHDHHIGFPLHHNHKQECITVKWESIVLNLRFITFKRAAFISLLIIFIVGLLTGAFSDIHGHVEVPHGDHMHEVHDHSSWITITFLILSVIALIIILLSTNHFLDHHLWKHIVKVHFLRIFLWTFGTLLIINFLTNQIQVDQWMEANKIVLIAFAVLIGLIPASGPHIIFITLFFNGTIPFSLLFINSVMQDGHGALPLFAESKRNFMLLKLIKLPIALITGLVLLSMGY